MIYFAQLPGGAIKIGTAVDVDGRIGCLKLYYGASPDLLATMPGGRPEEREIHERFAHHRIGQTEQFRPGADLMAFIGVPLLVGVNPDTVEAFDRELKAVRLELPVDVHRELRIEAARRDTHMSALARIAVEEFLSKRKAPGK